MCYNGLLSRAMDLVPARPLMPRRLAVLLTSPRSISNSSLFRTFCTPLQKSEAHPLPFQPLPASLQKRRACLLSSFLEERQERFPLPPLVTRHSPLSARNPFRMNTYKSVSKQRTLTPFRINTYAKIGGSERSLLTALRPLAFIPSTNRSSHLGQSRKETHSLPGSPLPHSHPLPPLHPLFPCFRKLSASVPRILTECHQEASI
jgi:hypothetical protein